MSRRRLPSPPWLRCAPPTLVTALLVSALAAAASPAAAAALPGFGTAEPPLALPSSSALRGAPLSAELDGDGRPDLVVLTEAGAVFVIRGLGGGAFGPPAAVEVRPGATALVPGDFDGDGRLDLAVQRVLPGETNVVAVSVLLGERAGGFRETADSGRYPTWGRVLPVPPAAADLDGDGVLDLVTVTVDPDDASRKLVVLLEGDGTGTFTAQPFLRTELDVHSVAAADLDRDGIADVVAAILLYRGGAVYALKGTGAFRYSDPVRIASGDDFVVAEFNGDGIPDLATSPTNRCPGCAASVYLGDGGLGFRSTFSAFPGSYGYPGPVEAGDVNGDGSTDLLVPAATQGLLAIYPGDGKGGFGEPTRLSAPLGSKLSDLDGDARPDLLFRHPAGWSVRRNTSGLGSASTTLVLPVVLSAAGEAGSSYTTRLTATNRGETTALLESTFTDATTGAATTGTRSLGAGDQITSSLDAIGLPSPAFGYRGTVRVRVTGASSADAVSVLALVQAPVGAQGSVGVAFGSIPAAAAFDGPSLLPWLREGDGDRTNLAVVNAGGPEEGAVTLRATVHPGEATGEAPVALPDVVLAPGGIRQVDRVLAAAGLAARRGWARIERVAGSASYLAYAVVNDASNSDGSWVPAVPAGRGRGEASLVVPVLVESDAYESELVVTNASERGRRLACTFVAEAVAAPANAVRFAIDLPAGSQLDWPEFVDALRALGLASLLPKGPRYAGALSVAAEDGDLEGIAALARTVTPAPAGRYGVATPALFASELATNEAWLEGLVQDSARRTNLAVVNAAAVGSEPGAFRVDVFWSSGGAPLSRLVDLVVPGGGWLQLNSILSRLGYPGVTTAYARVVRTRGTGPFLAYAVGNDGPGPGEGTGDGAYLQMQRPAPATP